MAKTATAAKSTTTVETNKTFSFYGVVRSYHIPEGAKHLVVKFSTLNKAKTRPIDFFANLASKDISLSQYIKSGVRVEVTVKEIAPDGDKRRFEVLNILSDKDKQVLQALLNTEVPANV